MANKKNPKKWITSSCKTCGKLFEMRMSRKRIYCSKKCSNADPNVKNKIIESQKKTFSEKYGMHPMHTDSTKDKLKQSISKKYGVEHYSKHPDYRKKVKLTMKERYGNENYYNVEKMRDTNLKKYGVEYVSQVKNLIKLRSQTKKRNHFEYIKKTSEEKNLLPLFTENEYEGYHFSKFYLFQCKKCQKNLKTTVYNLNNLFCDYCNPEKITTVENQFYLYLQSILPKEEIIERNNRTVLYGKELDFYVPSRKYAFEINGLYWHSEIGGEISKNYHLNKTKSCAWHGINLVHIFENEWINKQEIVKSIVKNLLKCGNETKINARECIIQEVAENVKNDFLNKNHIQGEDKSSIKLGLFHNNELVSLMTFRKSSRFEKNIEYELMRYCNKLNTTVNGAASKLFSHFVKKYSPKNIVSYSDRRFFSGNLYSVLGFNFVNHTPPSYHYITDSYKNLKNRMSFQKHKLKNILLKFDENISEWENMKNNNFDRIWDCGNSKWIYSRISDVP